MYEITIERTFAATHALRLPDGTMEDVHGHDWPVVVTVQAEQLDAMQTVMDFHELERHLDAVIRPWGGKHLNDVEPFAGGRHNPSAEKVAWAIATALGTHLRGDARLTSVRVGEAPGCTAAYLPGDPHAKTKRRAD